MFDVCIVMKCYWFWLLVCNAFGVRLIRCLRSKTKMESIRRFDLRNICWDAVVALWPYAATSSLHVIDVIVIVIWLLRLNFRPSSSSKDFFLSFYYPSAKLYRVFIKIANYPKNLIYKNRCIHISEIISICWFFVFLTSSWDFNPAYLVYPDDGVCIFHRLEN